MISSKNKLFKSLVIMLVFILFINSFGVVSQAEDNKQVVFVNERELRAEPGAIDSNGIIYFPMHPLCNALGITAKPVSQDTYKLTYAKLNREITIAKGNKTIIINGISHQLSFNVMGTYPVGTIEEYMIPLKYIVEQFGGEVNFAPELKRIYVTGDAPIKFKDKALEESVRALTKKPVGDIYKFDVQDIFSLDLSAKGITNIDDLKYFENLTYLDIRDNKISNLSAIENLKGLTALFVKGNDPSLDVFTPIAMFYENIKQTDISFDVKLDSNLELAIRTAIKKTTGKIEPKDIRGLAEFNASGKKILSIEGLNYMVSLKKLDLSNNSILNLGPIKNLTKLESLTLNKNGISDISALSKLQKLSALDLSNNKIKDLSFLKDLKGLNVLKLSDNVITDAAPINGLLNIKELYLSNNKLTDTFGLEKLMNLNTLYLKDIDPKDPKKVTSAIPKEKLKVFKDLFTKLKKTDLTKEEVGVPTVTGVTYSPTKATITPTPSPSTVPGDAILRYYIGKSTYTVNGLEYKMDTGVAPIIRNGRTGIPVKYIAQHIGASTGWDEKERKVTITYGSKVINLYVDIDYAMVDGKMTKLDVAPFIVNGRTMVPLRFVTETLGLETKWNEANKEITLIYKKNK
ncbi:stalk domain-containing protein [Pseudobacteroides cellulosolvens]|uniref:stalk domain-containing protein n=1 Tax=Pseudobacteroides cellulosolvens TaxID=35825 RepID=UPI00056AF7A4|nr:stalk domain-containing protein [Pseudobacteroides cellulosolvens]